MWHISSTCILTTRLARAILVKLSIEMCQFTSVPVTLAQTCRLWCRMFLSEGCRIFLVQAEKLFSLILLCETTFWTVIYTLCVPNGIPFDFRYWSEIVWLQSKIWFHLTRFVRKKFYAKKKSIYCTNWHLPDTKTAFVSSFAFPGASSYQVFLLFLPWLPCHFYLVAIKQRQPSREHCADSHAMP